MTDKPRGRIAFPPKKCMAPECQGQFGSSMPKGNRGGRGLCKSCFQKAANLVKRKVTTWEELEALGLAQSKYTSDYERALYEARKRRDADQT